MMKRSRVLAPDGIRVVRATERHAAAIRDGLNSGSAARTTRWHLPRALSTPDPPSMRRFAILDGDRVIGAGRLWNPLFSGLELGISIFDPAARGRGIGTYAVQVMCAVAFDELKTHRVELGVYPDNVAAIRVYEKCGFRREAVMRSCVHHEGRWRDVLWMGILRSDWRELAKGAGRTRGR